MGVLLGFGASTTFANRAPYHTNDGTITVCKSDQDGSLRVVPKDAYCKRWENKINWNGAQTAILNISHSGVSEFDTAYDSGHSRNVSSVNVPPLNPTSGYCVKLPFEPLIALSSDPNGGSIATLKSTAENFDDYCRGVDADVFVNNFVSTWLFSE